ncbi:MAG: MAPEG family protein, partial [Bdellovibrionales bacterium]
VQGTYTAKTYGFKKAGGTREDIPFPQPGFGGTLYRAIANLKEGLFYFVPLVLLTAILDISNDYTVWGAQIYVIARFLHVPCYLMGAPLRGVTFGFATLGCVLLAYGLFV